MVKDITTRIDDIEDRNRRSNLIIYGIEENEKGTWVQTESKVKGLIRNDLGIDKVIGLERVHRVGKLNTEIDQPQQVIAMFTSFKDKEMVRKQSF